MCKTVCRSGRVNDRDNVNRQERERQKVGKKGSQALRFADHAHSFGLIPSLVLEATSDTSKAE